MPRARRVIDEAWLEGEAGDPLDLSAGAGVKVRSTIRDCTPPRRATRSPVMLQPERIFMPRAALDDLEPIAIGAWILGTDGGGDAYHSLLEARRHWSPSAYPRRILILIVALLSA